MEENTKQTTKLQEIKLKQKEIDTLCCSLLTIESSNLYKGMLLNVPRRYCPSLEQDIVTDGKTIKIGSSWFNLTLKERCFTILRALLHTGLQHQQRAKDLKHDKLALKVWQLAADVITHQIIPDSNNYFNAPHGSVKICDIRAYLKDKKKDNEYTAEQIFRDLYNKLDPNSDNSLAGNEEFMKMLSEVQDDISTEEFGDSQKILENMNSILGKYNDPNLLKSMWDKIIKSSAKHAGSNTSRELMMLLDQLPKPKVPWQKVLKRYLNARLRPEREPNWKSPSRRYISGMREFYAPAWSQKKGIRKLVMLLDMSGSCFNHDTFGEFISNIDAIHKSVGCELVLINFDTQVIAEHTLEKHDRLIDRIHSGDVKLNGGGGTSFIECIERAIELKPSIIVCLTDGYGEFHKEKPTNIPVIWALLDSDVVPPWGQPIHID